HDSFTVFWKFVPNLWAKKLNAASPYLVLGIQSRPDLKTSTQRCISAKLPWNTFKNRLANIMPFEFNRVCLQPIRAIEGSDYINASFIDGYRHQKAYIAAQGPLAQTTEDLWRMLWEHNSTIVIIWLEFDWLGIN
uniref:protein-tyrosine-phosphatase n=1 Tax=Poecilia latipinna TaxID=48699 RepID=A0A3B3VW17_9TELE